MIVVALATAWLLVALAAALLLGGAVRMADHHAPVTDHLAGLPSNLTADDVLGPHSAQPTAR